ncbi:MAG: CpsD/CapB family tyrosine-protein kinase, partial [Epsilonproteobacteria bacterium]|nr:CpsD/CapB family tyrosine-protein kinase [Campylobacterota bacterium]
RGAGGKVILIGASSNEHKDRVLINSATIFHKAMSRVVVVDLDFRDPKLYKMLRMEGVYRDIVDYLNGDCKIEDILYSTRYEGLDFIPIKQIADNPSELVLYDRLSKLFNILRGSYDYIMINSTPFDIIKDFRYIIKYSDINLFVVEKFMTRKSSIVELKSIVEEDKINNIGFIYIDDV